MKTYMRADGEIKEHTRSSNEPDGGGSKNNGTLSDRAGEAENGDHDGR